MRKMKIGIVTVGHDFTVTDDERRNRDCDLSHCTDIRRRVDDKLIDTLTEEAASFLPPDTEYFGAHVRGESSAIDLEEADAYVIIPFGVPDIVYAVIYSKNKPVLFYVPPYGQLWSYGAVYYPYFVRDARKIDEYIGLDNRVFVCKGGQDLKDTLSALKVKFKLANTTALCIGEAMYEPFHSWNWGYEMIRAVQEKFGVTWKHISSERFLSLFASEDTAFEDLINKEAKENRMPDEYTTKTPEKMYRLFKGLISESGADIFTVNCLYSIVHTQCGATACYALSKLNDEGIVSACEADITTLLDMAITSYASEAPCFMLNPYLFPQDNKLFVSHCTSPTRHSYESEEKDSFFAYPYYEIPSMPCGIQVMKKEGPVTVTGISHDKLDKMVVVRANIVRNTAFPSCRTQMELDIAGDIKELAECYEGRHWALVYGDSSERIARACGVLGMKTQIL